MPIDVAAELSDLENRASFFRSERRKDVELYTLLADCMWLADVVRAENREAEITERLKDKLRRQTNRSRVYVEKASDVYTVIGRLVFQEPGDPPGGTAWRSAVAMREAVKRGIKPGEFVEFCRTQGGIDVLVRQRNNKATRMQVKVLHLTEPVTIEPHGTVTLTLRRDPRGYFDVIAQSSQGPA
jgi:hypothetical protein